MLNSVPNNSVCNTFQACEDSFQAAPSCHLEVQNSHPWLRHCCIPVALFCMGGGGLPVKSNLSLQLYLISFHRCPLSYATELFYLLKGCINLCSTEAQVHRTIHHSGFHSKSTFLTGASLQLFKLDFIRNLPHVINQLYVSSLLFYFILQVSA